MENYLLEKVNSLMESIVPGVTEYIEPDTSLSERDFDLASCEIFAWMIENNYDISVDDRDVEKWKTYGDIIRSIENSKGQ